MIRDPDVIADAKSKGLEPSLMTGEEDCVIGRGPRDGVELRGPRPAQMAL
jgi:hypothetical protein